MKLEIIDCPLYDICSQAIEQVLFLADRKNIRLQNQVNREIRARADKRIIERVLVNLLSNGIKFTPNNGNIEIRVYDHPGDTSRYRIEVIDNGEGIPADKIHMVFDRFVQIKERKSGGLYSTGIGLTFCKLAIEAHGGEIAVRSDKGIGATFYFDLAKSGGSIAVTERMPDVKGKMLPSIEFSEAEREQLRPFLSRLHQLLVYETTAVESLINQIDFHSFPGLSKWKHELDHALYSMNEERYQALLQMVENP